MKQHILPAIKLTFFSILLLVVAYTGAIWGIAQAATNRGKGETIIVNGKIAGYDKVGQRFDKDHYFWGRPSAVSYNAAGSGGSNIGPSNPDYLSEVQARVDTFQAHHAGVSLDKIPSELVTASASGLDPHISPEAAYLQAKRIAARRGLNEAVIMQLISQHTEKPFMGFLGTYKINVLKLNIALDEINKQQ
ncbi:K(+)-transporting ATPase subunit C [Flavihumibacter stibioxidans]|uniref:Potassium-transporting ATPase KdpC subunit n=1 Tax=Flavihumibacter stibioxidans TaxID=1834163 RepID=A0ABR7MDE5_9BACT|nr:K(+)-transporting ATPase subunit C [Flavihumibacter stibioxidans]MBC6492666.1 potassium-transporting ATPase subunit C [Flavihumibacter stibioxidans]